jgi:GDP-mannose 6-dehydrogenase
LVHNLGLSAFGEFEEDWMKISVFGLGYVGTVCAACLADQGHTVIGVDVNPEKLEILGRGRSPIIETDIDSLVGQGAREGRLSVTSDALDAVVGTDLSLVCVGTPSRANGSLDIGAVETVVEQIGRAIATKGTYHSVVIRSTVLPGTLRDRLLPVLEEATRGGVGAAFGLASNPEFMREGSAVADFRNPPKTVIGEIDERTADMLEALYRDLPAPLFRVPVEVAELAKYADNVWHALKVAFGNEMGTLCKTVGIDSHALMDIFCSDTKLNISKAYLKPGFAFGGSCLPKDTRALAHFCVSRDVDAPVIANVLPSNRRLVERGVDWILETGAKRIAFLGFSFKAGTDDLRESPFVTVIEQLIGKGCSIRIFDKNVELARLVGANKQYLYHVIPHIAELMVESLDEALADAEVIVATANAPEYLGVVEALKPGQRLLDFARIPGAEVLGERYDGFLW